MGRSREAAKALLGRYRLALFRHCVLNFLYLHVKHLLNNCAGFVVICWAGVWRRGSGIARYGAGRLLVLDKRREYFLLQVSDKVLSHRKGL